MLEPIDSAPDLCCCDVCGEEWKRHQLFRLTDEDGPYFICTACF